MRCKACNKILSDAELNRKTKTKDSSGKPITVFLDLCGKCNSASVNYPGYLDREWEGGDVQSDIASLVHQYKTGGF